MNNQKGNQSTTPLKEFNSTPIDTPTPVSLGDNLDPSKSLSEESLTIENSKSQPTSEPEVPTESSTEPLLEPETEFKPTSEINPESKTELDQETEVIPMSEVEPQPNPNLEPNSEPETQPQPEPEVELKPQPDIEPKLNNKYTPDPMPTVQTETNPPDPVSQDPEIVKQKIEEVLSYNSANSVVNSKSDKPQTSGLLKILFTLSLIVFIAVAMGLAYFILNPSLKTNPETKVVPTTAPVQSNITCELNGFIYTLDQSFPSADGCNTCTCVSADNIACTEKACADVTTTPATKSATSLTVTPVSANKTVLGTGNYVGKTPFDPDKVKIGDIVLDKFRVAEKTTNKYFFTKIYTTPVDKGVDIDGSNISFFFDKNKIVVCDGLPCCFPGEENKAENWQEEWCTGY